MAVPAGHGKQAMVHLLHAKIGSCFHFRRDRGCRLPVRRGVAYSPVADGQSCQSFLRRKGGTATQGQAARRPAPHSLSPQARCRPSEASTAVYGPCRVAPGLLEAAGARRARVERLADSERASSGACRVLVGAGLPLQEVGTARNPRQPGGGGPGAGPPVRARTPGPASGRTQPERGGVARVPGGHPTRGEGESGPDAAPPSEGF